MGLYLSYRVQGGTPSQTAVTGSLGWCHFLLQRGADCSELREDAEM